ncbi:hypothetical protein K469DRAFT_670172 [Zopfia rhizophila CBS 207.26]|uniref:Thioesterase domain-containing protein n=1 Tax=Zopfia rhizophila CBS 207.26 TaxID=1314779 RepID=A0A6A6DRQ5_9PEZI|nr:hypothetical protein K469DRAFT_670172 [Zopfia rhizophila CBS 207.26]
MSVPSSWLLQFNHTNSIGTCNRTKEPRQMAIPKVVRAPLTSPQPLRRLNHLGFTIVLVVPSPSFMYTARSPAARPAFCGNAVLGRMNFLPLRNSVIKPPPAPPLFRRIQFPQRRFRGTITSEPLTSAAPNAEQSTQSPPSPPKKALWVRASTVLALTLLTFGIGFTMTAAQALETLNDFRKPPTDAETLTLFTPDSEELAEIEQHILVHPLTQSLIEDPKYIPSRPHLKIPPKLRPHNLTGGTLLGQDKIAVPPLQFSTEDGSTFVSLQYLGSALCGHPGIVHGGLLATILDEGLGRCCFPALPNKVAVTASLKIDYRKPCLASQYVVLRAETTKVEGRKAWVKGRLETLVDESKGEKPDVLVEAEALFIEPKQAATMTRVYHSPSR